MAGLTHLLRKIIAGFSSPPIKPDGLAHANDGKSSPNTEALSICQARVDEQPDDASRRIALAIELSHAGQLGRAIAEYQITVQRHPDLAEAHSNLGLLLQEQGMPGAEDALRRACEIAPENQEFATRLRLLMSNKAPMWHFSMMNDTLRANAYETALQRALQPNDHVLDIGTGSGLLSLMAARAGAQHVTSCEAVPEIAAKARQIIAANGYTKNIDVIGQPSSHLKVPDHLPQPADLLVSEIFSSELIGEGALPSFEHARKYLLKPDARIIPAQAWIVGQLAGAAALEPYLRVGTIAGFNLQSFNEFSPCTVFPTEWNIDLEYQSAPFNLFDFDFQHQTEFPPQSLTLRIPVTHSGLCHGILQWLRLRLYDDIFYENAPAPQAHTDHAIGHWRWALHTFPEPLHLQAGQTLEIQASHNRNQLIFIVIG